MAKRGPYRKGEVKRAEILEAALDIFATEGYRGTSLRKVAARCDLSLPGLMHYFDSKEDLLTEVLRARDETERTRHPDYRVPEDPVDTMRTGARTPGLVELFVSLAASAGDPGHPAHEFFPERYEALRAAVTRYVRSALDAGRLATDIPAERLAVVLLAVADGVQLQWLADRSVDMPQALTDALRLLDAGTAPNN
ncbi:TetR/AcrR family transcriptional regulator [Streptomyces sp. 8L]|uniref:TetR/AcrR family transcriptional regulator n=1 Tax=Streptomyces sp. 8L TaxID=2877242 RepID=UPI001CD52E66|nr:TetR/AcrR family transcriptional regulator [Streptomyces sp. 8L]MCA1221501.1 TetR/AcrR family transcriptional regulator [Streptomyces sp. 8L]